MQICFLGTPDFAVSSLVALYESRFDIAGVFTQPDRPRGRGNKLAMPPVKQQAQLLGLPVFQFEKIRMPQGVEQLKALEPDCLVTAAFGQILSQEILDIPRYGCINVHASILPQYRGAAPIQWAIMQGESHTGVTTMLTDSGIDTGPMLLCERIAIHPEDTSVTLTHKLAAFGAQLLIRTLRNLHEIIPTPQPKEGASYFPMIKKCHGAIDWNRHPAQIVNHIRAMDAWPGAFSYRGEALYKFWKAEPTSGQGTPGTILAANPADGLIIACGQEAIRILEIQQPAGKRIAVRDFLRGHSLPVGERFHPLEQR